MQMTVTGRHFDISDSLRQHIEDKLTKLSRYLEETAEAHVVLSVEKHRHLAEMTIQTNGVTMRGVEETHDMYVAVDTVIEKLATQVKRRKEKESDRKGRTSSKDVAAMMEAEDEADDEIQPVETAKVIRSPKVAVKPMSIDEAAMQMPLTDNDFLAFINSETDQMNVMYRRRDGHYGLIEPEF